MHGSILSHQQDVTVAGPNPTLSVHTTNLDNATEHGVHMRTGAAQAPQSVPCMVGTSTVPSDGNPSAPSFVADMQAGAAHTVPLSPPQALTAPDTTQETNAVDEPASASASASGASRAPNDNDMEGNVSHDHVLRQAGVRQNRTGRDQVISKEM